MKNIVIFFLLFPSEIFGDYIIHEGIHESPYSLPCTIEAFLNSQEENIHRFSLLYRSKGSVEYIEEPMILIGHFKYISQIPGNFMVREQVEYYLLLELSSEGNITYPINDAVRNPMTINIDISKEKIVPITLSEINNFDIVGLSPEIIIISPQPGERVKRRDLFIALSYFGEKNINPSKVRVYLDGLDVSNRADIDSTYLSLTSEAITPGIHTITVNITNKFDQKFNDISWSFTVLPGNLYDDVLIQQQSGNVWINYTGANVNNTVMQIGEMNVFYEIDLDLLQFTGHYNKSSLENKYDQARDKYDLNIKNEIINITIGDSYPSIDQYALNGHYVRGVNFKYQLSPFSLNIVQGNTARVVQGDPLDGAMAFTGIDSSTSDWIISLNRNNYTFQQELLAAKLGFHLGEKFYLDANIIKVEDNISSVSREIANAKIMITTNDNTYSTTYDSLDSFLLDNVNVFGINTYIDLPTENWIGSKPRDNFIYGSNIKFGFDDSRIQLSSGFSISFLNRNKWNNLYSISALDTFSVDTNFDGLFLGSYMLDQTEEALSQYGYFFNFGTNQQPLVPLMFLSQDIGILDLLNMSNLNRYIELRLRYLGHRVELGNRRNAPDYYSILNPYLKTNYTETYFSDRINIFQNKLLLYYKWSKIVEGLYPERVSPTEIRKSLFNISLFPGTGLPTFNISFSSSNSSNNEDNIIGEITYLNSNDTDTTINFLQSEKTVNNLFTISMSNQFKFWGDQIMSLSILLYDQMDKVEEEVNLDTLQSLGYMPKDATSESYGISLKSVYSNYWESTLYLNTNYYDFGHKGFVHYQSRNLYNLQLNIVYLPQTFITKFIYGLSYSIGRGNQDDSYMRNYSFNIKAESNPLENIKLSLYLDYHLKYMITNHQNSDNLFFRAEFRYDI